jgi:acyl carrier protein
MDELVEQLRRQIIVALNLEDRTPEQIDPAAPLFGEGLGLDSIDALELVVMLEKHYGIRITDIEVGRRAFSSVNALAEFIRESQRKCQKSES